MTNEEAIKLIDDRMCFGRGKWSEHHRPVIDEYWQAGKMAIKALEAEPHWIPVTERLPESKEEDLEYPTVLITSENEEIMLGCFYESTKEWGTGEYFDKKCDPIAWMPLPEPYKGVTE